LRSPAPDCRGSAGVDDIARPRRERLAQASETLARLSVIGERFAPGVSSPAARATPGRAGKAAAHPGFHPI